MGKIVSVVSSPRMFGNCDTIANKVMGGAMGISTNTFSLYYTSKMAVPGCDACQKCKTAGRCVLNDDMTEAVESLRDADGLIVATPVYFGREPWSLASFIDRLYSLLDLRGNPSIPSGKELIIIVSYSDDRKAAEDVARHIEEVFSGIFGFKLIGTILFWDRNGEYTALNDPDLTSMAIRFGSTFSISKSFGTNVVSIAEGDARRGTSKIPYGTVWTNDDRVQGRAS